MSQQYKVVMLPSKSASNLVLVNDKPHHWKGDKNAQCNYQHLYVIDMLATIKAGDKRINTAAGIVWTTCENEAYMCRNGDTNWQKIIASTDETLGLPIIDPQFIDIFIKGKGDYIHVDIEIKHCEDTSKDYVAGIGQPTIEMAFLTVNEI